MKRFTHPQLESTLVQRKDGSTYTKYWFFFRSAISLEVDTKNWPGDTSYSVLSPRPKNLSESSTVRSLEHKASRKGRSLFNF